jgi:hypothetical protein
LVQAAGATRCELAIVSCCLQKTPGPTRVALSRAGKTFSLPKAALGLTNLTPQAEGVEASLTDNLRARELRLALRRLLHARSIDVRVGEEMRGLNRRRAQGSWLDLATRALGQRGLEPPTASELEFHGANARRDHATIRRLSLPRTLLGRLVELAIVFDRGALLEEAGLHVQVAELFERRVTPRNTLILGSTHM